MKEKLLEIDQTSEIVDIKIEEEPKKQQRDNTIRKRKRHNRRDKQVKNF